MEMEMGMGMGLGLGMGMGMGMDLVADAHGGDMAPMTRGAERMGSTTYSVQYHCLHVPV
jgi:hypothetical protein